MSASQADPAADPHAQLGSPLAEQRRLISGRAVGWAPLLGAVRIEGEDAGDFLGRMLARTPSTRPGASSESLLLEPNGRIRFALGLIAGDGGFWALCEPDLAAPLTEWVGRMRFRSRVAAVDCSAETSGLVWFGAPEWADALRPLAIWRDPWAAVQPGGVQYAAPAAADYAGWTLRIGLFPTGDVAAARARAIGAGADSAGWLAVDALRVAAARPRQATEADDRAIPPELDWMRTAVQLDKGCFPGQETIAKVHNLGHPPRRLVRLQLDGAPDVLPGTPVQLDGAVVGRITSAAVHWEMGPIALALIRRDTPVDAVLTVGDGQRRIAAAQETIVPPDAGGVASSGVRALRAGRRGHRRPGRPGAQEAQTRRLH